ncbi:pyruvate kinase [Rapidithrix thailandica]|uniref:Pyruvate kinase n=1 Tax=Rapidithrix thailandica TaxID=413964 RepID=A0AAW9RV44_9BACT
MSTPFSKTKIVATVGPSSNTKQKLLELMVAGVDVFRLNFSHGTHEDHKKVIEHIKELRKTFNKNVSILQDLQGPKIRIGQIEEGQIELVEGEELVITTEDIIGKKGIVSTTYTTLVKDVKAGDTILLDDGKIELKVFKVEGPQIHTHVVIGGILKPRKGMNLPDTDISEPSLTKKDKKDLEFGLEHGVDWIAISFVRSPADIIELKNIINEHKNRAKVVAKIERPEALRHIDEIVEVSDALMVARGDLGIEIQMEDVPMYQKQIVSKCNEASKPVIIATQMMESMIENPRPTRAEANDVANAVIDGADAVMLSAETASGKYPLQTIQHMSAIVRSVEQQADIYHKYYKDEKGDADFGSKVVINSAVHLTELTNANAIIGMTNSGFTAFQIAKHRPLANIFIFTSNRPLLNTLNLVWGVRAFYYNKQESTDQTFADVEEILVKEGLLRKGDVYINVASMPLKAKKKTNTVKFTVVE